MFKVGDIVVRIRVRSSAAFQHGKLYEVLNTRGSSIIFDNEDTIIVKNIETGVTLEGYKEFFELVKDLSDLEKVIYGV